MRRVAVVACALGLFQVAACGRIAREVRLVADRPVAIGELWQEPSNLAQRDLS